MFCGKCGTENIDGSRFCKGCGQPLFKESNPETDSSVGHTESSISKPVPNPAIGRQGSSVNTNSESSKVKPSKTLFIGIAVVAVLIIAGVFFINKNARTINLNDYLSFESSGYDGYGNVTANIDWESIKKKYGDKIEYSENTKDGLGSFSGMMKPVDVIRDSVSVKLSKDSELSNGESIEYTWNIDDDMIGYTNCELKHKDGTYSVSGLEEIGTFDAFNGLSVEFSGIAPNGTVNLNYTGGELNSYDFSCDKTNGLSNGDVIKVTINTANMENYARNLGKVPAATEKEFRVEGLDSYLSKIDEIDESAMNSMKQQAKDVFDSIIANGWDDKTEKLESFNYIGDYLMTSKRSDAYGRNNILYLVYQVQVRDKYSNEDDSYDKINDFYWYIGYHDLMIDGQNKVAVNITDYDVPYDRVTFDSGVGAGWWNSFTWNYNGYETLDELYKKVVMSNVESYNHEDNVDSNLIQETQIQGMNSNFTEDEDSGKNKQKGEEGIIFPDSSEKIIDSDDIKDLSDEELRYAINEIYARNGYIFKDKELKKFYNKFDWYEETVPSGEFTMDMFNKIERKNVEAMQKERDSR